MRVAVILVWENRIESKLKQEKVRDLSTSVLNGDGSVYIYIYSKTTFNLDMSIIYIHWWIICIFPINSFYNQNLNLN